MNQRTELIFTDFITKMNVSMTADEIGEKIFLSTRTIYSLIRSTREIYMENGFSLEGTSGRGYSLKIHDPVKFQAYKENIQLTASLIRNISFPYSDTFTAVMKAVISREGSFTLKDICEISYYSQPTVRSQIPFIEEYLSQFNLYLIKNGSAYMTIGPEFQKRWCAISLRLSFSSITDAERISDYDNLFHTSSEIQIISNVLAGTLLQKHFHILDFTFREYVLFLSLSGKRFVNGYCTEPIASSFEALPSFAISKSIFQKLKSLLPDTFDFNHDEILQFAVMLTAFCDPADCNIFLPSVSEHPLFHQSLTLTDLVKIHLEKICGCCLLTEELTRQLQMIIFQILLINAASQSMEIKFSGWLLNKKMNRSPLCLYLSSEICSVIKENTSIITGKEHFYNISNILIQAINKIPISFTRSHILTASGAGIHQAEYIVKFLKKDYAEFISSIKPITLYEAHQFSNDQTYLITDIESAYHKNHYQVPVLYFDSETDTFPDDVYLKEKFDVTPWLPKQEDIIYHESVSVSNIEKFFEMLGIPYSFQFYEPMFHEDTYIPQLILVLPCRGKESLDCYTLKRRIHLNGFPVKEIWCAFIHFDGQPAKVIVMERLLRLMLKRRNTKKIMKIENLNQEILNILPKKSL